MTNLHPNTTKPAPALQIDVTSDMAVYKNMPNTSCGIGKSKNQMKEEVPLHTYN